MVGVECDNERWGALQCLQVREKVPEGGLAREIELYDWVTRVCGYAAVGVFASQINRIGAF